MNENNHKSTFEKSDRSVATLRSKHDVEQAQQKEQLQEHDYEQVQHSEEEQEQEQELEDSIE